MERFSYINSDFFRKDELLYHINRAGSSQVEKDFMIERNSSYPYCVFHYIVEGSVEVFYKDRLYNVKKGQCFVLNSYEAHRYSANTDERLIINWIEFIGGDCAKLIESYLDLHTPIIYEQTSCAINKYILKILNWLKGNSKNGQIYISKAIYAILMCLMSEFKTEKLRSVELTKFSDIQIAINYISNNINQRITMEQLAKTLNYNHQYFAKMFQNYTGSTPAKYILNAKISRAKFLLSSSDVPIVSLSEQLGFFDASHFIRIFKKAEGLTPAEFRKESISYRTPYIASMFSTGTSPSNP